MGTARKNGLVARSVDVEAFRTAEGQVDIDQVYAELQPQLSGLNSFLNRQGGMNYFITENPRLYRVSAGLMDRMTLLSWFGDGWLMGTWQSVVEKLYATQMAELSL